MEIMLKIGKVLAAAAITLLYFKGRKPDEQERTQPHSIVELFL